MRPDTRVELRADGERIEKWIHYTIADDLFSPEGGFEFETPASTSIKKGEKIQIWINDKLEMTGLVDKVVRKTSRQKKMCTITGRSVGSVLVDSSVTKFGTCPTKLPALVEYLVRGLPFIGKEDFEFLSGSAKARVKRSFVEVSPGDSVFDVIKKAANSQGYLFWITADGRFVVDRPATTGEAVFRIVGTENECNYISGSATESIEDCHSEVRVVGESQDLDGGHAHVKIIEKADDFPFFRPLVVSWNEADGLAKNVAKLRLALEKSHAERFEYTVSDHVQNGRNWTKNEFCNIQDPNNGAQGIMLVVGRTFELTREGGPRTNVRLQPGGSLDK